MDLGVEAAVIARGSEYGVVDRILVGKSVGTLFLRSSRQGQGQAKDEALPARLASPPLDTNDLRIEDMARVRCGSDSRTYGIDVGGPGPSTMHLHLMFYSELYSYVMGSAW